MLGLAGTARAASRDDESTLKATFLYRLLSEMTWPTNALGPSHKSLDVAVLGNDDFLKAASGVFANETAHERPLKVSSANTVEEAARAHVLFIPGSERRRQRQLLQDLQHLPVLTVGESDGFCEDGGMVNLRLVKERIRIEVNAAALKDAGLKLNSQVLKLATIVGKRSD